MRNDKNFSFQKQHVCECHRRLQQRRISAGTQRTVFEQLPNRECITLLDEMIAADAVVCDLSSMWTETATVLLIAFQLGRQVHSLDLQVAGRSDASRVLLQPLTYECDPRQSPTTKAIPHGRLSLPFLFEIAQDRGQVCRQDYQVSKLSGSISNSRSEARREKSGFEI